MIAIDPDGEDTYIVLYGKGPLATDLKGAHGDQGNNFRNAAQTRAREIASSSSFHASKDAIVVKEVGTRGEFISAVNTQYPSGPTASVDVYSHGFVWSDYSGTGLNLGGGPKGTRDKLFAGSDVPQLAPTLTANASVTLYGCLVGALGDKSLAQAMANWLGVTVKASPVFTHFTNTSPTPRNPSVHQLPDHGSMISFKPPPSPPPPPAPGKP